MHHMHKADSLPLSILLYSLCCLSRAISYLLPYDFQCTFSELWSAQNRRTSTKFPAQESVSWKQGWAKASYRVWSNCIAVQHQSDRDLCTYFSTTLIPVKTLNRAHIYSRFANGTEVTTCSTNLFVAEMLLPLSGGILLSILLYIHMCIFFPVY